MEKNLQKGVGKYRFPGFIGRGTIILKNFTPKMSAFACLSTEYVKGLTKVKRKNDKNAKISTNLLHLAKSFDSSNQRDVLECSFDEP